MDEISVWRRAKIRVHLVDSTLEHSENEYQLQTWQLHSTSILLPSVHPRGVLWCSTSIESCTAKCTIQRCIEACTGKCNTVNFRPSPGLQLLNCYYFVQPLTNCSIHLAQTFNVHFIFLLILRLVVPHNLSLQPS